MAFLFLHTAAMLAAAARVGGGQWRGDSNKKAYENRETEEDRRSMHADENRLKN